MAEYDGRAERPDTDGKHRRDRQIVVFDSGYGGISVLKKLLARMPDEQYLYFGDSANAPYGPRPAEEVRELTLRAIGGLLDGRLSGQMPKAVVIACNTATAAALRSVEELLPGIPVIGIRPALRQAEAAGCRHILCLATAGTLASESYARQLRTLQPETEVLSLAAPGIVTYVESGKRDREGFSAWLEELLAPVRERPLDAAVLGCTHFPFAKEELRQALRREIRFFDAGSDVAEATCRALERNGRRADGSGSGGITFVNSCGTREALARAWALLQTDC